MNRGWLLKRLGGGERWNVLETHVRGPQCEGESSEFENWNIHIQCL